MKVTRLVLDDFRNISHIDVNFAGNVNVILGKNAQGKTNMLESVYLFSQGKSFRASRDRDLIRFNSVKSNLQMEFSTDKREQLYEINLFSDKRRRIFLNEVEIKKYADMNGNFYTVLFAPEHLNLVKEGPSERRKFLDIAISSLKPRYFKATEDYSRLLIHKNALLRDIHKYPTLRDTLDVWNDRIAATGAYITFMRKSYIDKILEICNENHKEISKGKETLTLKYQFFEESTDTEFLSDINECKKRLLLKIQENTEEDIRTCISNIGPHRDDIDILINEKSARMFASQGQQRSAVLSMKLAEADMIYYSSGEQPVMLLDDIFSELDKSRQNYILKKIKDRQVILTSCDKGKYRSLKDSAFFKMDNGNLSSLF